MALYAIGDLHLSLGADKPMDAFGGAWSGYLGKIKEGFKLLHDDDVCVLCGDQSWAISLETSLDDFRFIDALPGRKILLKGNHDYWWNTVTKVERFFAENGIISVEILNNNCFFYEDIAICGTRGWFDEGEGELAAHKKKIMLREAGRLETSIKAAGGARENICFFHYPPRYRGIVCTELIEVMERYNVRRCYYGHIHGAGHKFAPIGDVCGINYNMVSADYLNFTPKEVEIS